MRCCIERTGGLCVLADSFKQSVFKESFRRVFTKVRLVVVVVVVLTQCNVVAMERQSGLKQSSSFRRVFTKLWFGSCQ